MLHGNKHSFEERVERNLSYDPAILLGDHFMNSNLVLLQEEDQSTFSRISHWFVVGIVIDFHSRVTAPENTFFNNFNHPVREPTVGERVLLDVLDRPGLGIECHDLHVTTCQRP